MKKLIILIIISFSIGNAQDKEPNPWEFIWGFSNTPRPFVLDSFPQTSILTGGQWSGSTRMNNALKNNATTAGTYASANATVETPINLIIQPKWFDANYYQPGYLGAVMMQYEPTLPINIFNQGTILRPSDPSNPIFGFRNRKGTILNSSAEGNYSRLILYKDSNYVDSTVLSDIWPQPRFNSHDLNEQVGMTDGYLGKKWYLAINLRRLNPATDIIKNNDVVLKIKMPYTQWNNLVDSIKFNKVPINSAITTEELHFIDSATFVNFPYIDSRGYAQLMHIDTTTTIEITKNMIPISTDNSENITIYAEFHTNDDPKANPKFLNQFSANRIKDFDIKVEYKGGLDIAIDWIRVENHQAHILNRGEVDWIAPSNPNDSSGRGRKWFWSNDKDTTYTYITEHGEIVDSIPHLQHFEINDIYNTIKSSLSHIKAKSNNWQDAKLFRLYFQDIEVPFFYFWGTLRYANKFASGMFIASDVENYPELYQYYTKAPDRYFGMKFNSYEPLMSQPFFRAPYQSGFYTDSAYNLFGYKYGFSGEQPNDTLTSGYETFFTNYSRDSVDPLIFNTIKTFTDSAYTFNMKKSNSVQTEWEMVIKEKFNHPIHSNYLYLNSPWYVNLFIGTNYEFRNWLQSPPLSNPINKYVTANQVSSKTAESIRLLMNTSLLMGAKGIFYDREETYPLYRLVDTNIRLNTSIGLGDGDKPVFYNPSKKYEFIENDSLGGDFTGGYSDIYNIGEYILPDSIAKYANITSDRIYIGTKSIRLEVKKIVDWIRLNDKELMDMRLQAIYSKGYKTFESRNPYKYSRWSTSPLRKIVDVNNIRTRKLFEPKHTMIHNLNPDYEFKDSSFFDITLLQYKNNTDDDLLQNKSAVYLGVINRRTDPLIFRDTLKLTPVVDSLRELMFFTAAEFDDKVRYGGVDLWGVNQDSTWWQNQWWKRLGAREIKIPLNIKPYGNGTYILAQEIGIDSLDSLGWRYDEKYYQRVDTILTYKDSLMTKLLPGQGKIIKLDFVPYFFNDPTKDLDTNNDHCYFCDIFNDFNAFKFNVVKQTGVEEGCCYTVSLTYDGDCEFEDIPFRLIIEGEAGNAFTDSNPINGLKDSLNPKIKYKDIQMDLDSETGTVNLGTFCVFESTNKYKFSLLAGKDKDDKFIGCDREMQFKVECDEDNDPPKDCCEGLSVDTSTYSSGIDPRFPNTGWYCTKYNINTSFDSDCIYGVSIAGGGVQKDLQPIGNTPIDFTSGGGKEFTLCYPMKECGSFSQQTHAIKLIKMQFLSKEGTIVCEIDVPAWLPCIYNVISDFEIGDPPTGGPVFPAKASNEKQDSKTYESESFKVTIWPNPTSGVLNVEIDSKVDTEVDINFISNIGANLTTENGVALNKGVNAKTYNLKDYSSGVYYLQINGKDGNIVLPIMLNK